MKKNPDFGHRPWYENLSVMRWIFAIFGILVMLFAGGCSLFFLGEEFVRTGSLDRLQPLVSLGIFVGFAVALSGILIWWLAAKVGRSISNQ